MKRKKKRKKVKKLKILKALLLSLLGFAIAVPAVILCLAFIGVYREEHQDVSYDTEAGREQIWENRISNIILAGVVIYEYAPPKYNFKLDEITVEISVSGGTAEKEYDIAFVNDLHLITDSKPGDVLEEKLPTVRERHDNLSVTADGVHAEELWPEVIKFLNYHNFDAVIFGGDILDYCSHSNMAALTEGFDNLKYPKEKVLYLRSDHDYGGWYGGGIFTDMDGFMAQAELWDGDQSEGWIAFDDFLIVGINKSYQNLSDERLQFLMGKLNAEKPVIVATHVPFYSEVDESLAEKSMEVRNRIYYWNQEDSSYSPDQNTQKLIDSMYDEDSNVVQILAAHLHAAWDGNVTEHVKEHIFAPAYEGRIGVIHVRTVNDKEGNR
ncbi:MAG: metallophosphoesterase [Bacteroidales bacterium]|nr:metallophosphoesterase [Lachnoclostridium sp.]MCM1383394.1 metallophosphoesterase [Lachnoclostridium sp.]MCM1464242.1 metallophosphoesterase [Bacteroidales bacterium]